MSEIGTTEKQEIEFFQAHIKDKISVSKCKINKQFVRFD